MAKVPLPVLIATSILAVVFLLSSMVLFRRPLSHMLGFLLEILSLVDTYCHCDLIGRNCKDKKDPKLCICSHVCSHSCGQHCSLYIIWIIAYGSFCDDCTKQEQTLRYVEECDDECCFTESSRPIAVIFIVFSVLTMLCGFIGVGMSIPYMRYSKDSNVSSKRR